MPSQDTVAYLADLVRRDDRDRFLMAMFAPRPARDGLMALYAFNAEVAKIRESVSEGLIGHMKLQWWRDVVAAVYEKRAVPQGNPVVEALARIVGAHDLPRAHFDALLDARAQDMADESPDDVMELEAYAEGTAARLNFLALQILNVRDQASMDAARHTGIAWALTGILRAVLFHARANRFLLPQDLMVAESLTGHDLQERRNAAKIASVIAHIARTAHAHVDKARSYRAAVDRKALPVLLGAKLTEQYLTGLARRRFDVFDPRHGLQRPSVVALTWSAWRGRY